MSIVETGPDQSSPKPGDSALEAWQRPRRGAVRAAGLDPSRCRAVGPHFVISPERMKDDALIAALAGVRHDPDAVVVLAAAADAASLLREQAHELALTATARGATRLVLAASGLGSAAPNGKRPATRIAELAGITVVAPGGAVAVQADGTLRVDAFGAEQPAWWDCPPSGPPTRLGVTWPPAAAAQGRAGQPAPVAGPEGADVQALTGGVWVRAAGRGGEPAPMAFERISAPPGTAVLVVGTPQEPQAAQAAVVSAATSLRIADRLLISAPWADLGTLRTLAAVLAAHRGEPVRAAVGLPMTTASGYSTRLLDRTGSPTWEPLLTELTAMPDVRRVVASGWRAGGSAYASAGGALPEVAGWEVELVPAGVWIRPAGRPADRGPRLRTPDPGRLLVCVGADGVRLPRAIWDCLPDVLQRLPVTEAEAFELALDGSPEMSELEEAWALARLHGWVWTGPDPRAAEPEVSAQLPVVRSRSIVDLALPESDQILAATAPTHLSMADTPGPKAPTEPAQEEDPAASAWTVPAAPAVARSVRVFEVADVPPVNAISGTGQRDAFKALLGAHYVPLLNRAQLAATRLPGLRHGAPDQDIRPDLVAVLAFRLDGGKPATRAQLVSAARSGRPGHLEPYLQCLASGLRLLPSHQGVVLLGAHAQEGELAQYRPERLLAEPAPLTGLSAGDVQFGGNVEFAVWSTTGRRTSLFDGPSGEQEITFAPGTRFAVVDVIPPTDPDRPTRVLLREVGPTGSEGMAAHEAGIRARLDAWLRDRDQNSPAGLRRPEQPERYQATPGVMAE